jgi:hypothetical protein
LFFNSCVLQDFQNSMESRSEKDFLQHLEKSLATISGIRKMDAEDLISAWYSFNYEQDNIYSSFIKSYLDQKD